MDKVVLHCMGNVCFFNSTDFFFLLRMCATDQCMYLLGVKYNAYKALVNLYPKDKDHLTIEFFPRTRIIKQQRDVTNQQNTQKMVLHFNYA